MLVISICEISDICGYYFFEHRLHRFNGLSSICICEDLKYLWLIESERKDTKLN